MKMHSNFNDDLDMTPSKFIDSSMTPRIISKKEYKLMSETEKTLYYEHGYWCSKADMRDFNANPNIYFWEIDKDTKQGKIVEKLRFITNLNPCINKGENK